MRSKLFSEKKSGQLKIGPFNKIEWLNCFNENLIIESISNKLITSTNHNKKSKALDKRKKNLFNKTNISVNNIFIKINSVNKKSMYKNYFLNKNEEFSKEGNYSSDKIKELCNTHRKMLSFEFQENISMSEFLKKYNKRIKVVKKHDSKNENEKNNKSLNYSEMNSSRLKNRQQKNKSSDLKGDNNLKKNNEKNNKYNWLVNNHKGYFKKNDLNSSYALRHKIGKDFGINGHFNPNEDRNKIIKNKIILGRTLPEMIVLNNYGLVSDEDYLMYQKIVNYNKVNDQKRKKIY